MGRLNRRIPQELRKRTAQSCDLCKTRRCKCVPSGQGNACVSCLDQGVQCQYTAPRKQRFYGSIDDLSDRYRCLEAIVKAAFPDDATATTTDLIALGNKLDISMPDISSTAKKDIKLENLVREPEAHFSPRPIDGPAAGADPTSYFSTKDGQFQNGRDRATLRPEAGSGSTGNNSTSDGESPPPAVIRDPSGNEHYIGPSGTLNFLNQLRNVFMSTMVIPEIPGQSSAASTMPQLGTAETLEADDPASAQSRTVINSTTSGTTISRDLVRPSAGDWQAALCLLPPTEMLEALINCYFQTTHEDFPLFRRQVFDSQFNLYIVYARKQIQLRQPDASCVPDWGWLGCLYMMMVFGSTSNPRIAEPDSEGLKKRYIGAARMLLPQLLSKCTLTNLCTIILLAIHLQNNNERNAAWNLTGTAIRMAFAIGLHRKPNPSSASAGSPEQDSRSIVLSTLYSLDLFLAASLGRPSGLSETDIEIFPLTVGNGTDGSATDPELLSLTVGLNSILQRTRLMYAKRKPTYGGSSDFPTTTGVDDILQCLQRWRQDLASHARFDLHTISRGGVTGSPTPVSGQILDYNDLENGILRQYTLAHLRSMLMLHVQFHYIGIITTRHFLLHDIAAARMNSGSSRGGISTLAQTCVFHSHQLAYIFLLMDRFALINGLTGLDVFFGYWAGMLLNLLLLRPKTESIPADSPDQPGVLSELVRRVHDVVSRTDKCGTMKRLSSVMDTFVVWAHQVERKGSDPTGNPSVAPQAPMSIAPQSSANFAALDGNQAFQNMPAASGPRLMQSNFPGQAPMPMAQTPWANRPSGSGIMQMNLSQQQAQQQQGMFPNQSGGVGASPNQAFPYSFTGGGGEHAAMLGMVDMEFDMKFDMNNFGP